MLEAKAFLRDTSTGIAGGFRSQQNPAAANLAAAGFACLTASAHFFRKHGGEDAILPAVVFFFSLAGLFHEVELGAASSLRMAQSVSSWFFSSGCSSNSA